MKYKFIYLTVTVFINNGLMEVGSMKKEIEVLATKFEGVDIRFHWI